MDTERQNADYVPRCNQHWGRCDQTETAWEGHVCDLPLVHSIGHVCHCGAQKRPFYVGRLIRWIRSLPFVVVDEQTGERVIWQRTQNDGSGV